MATDLTFTLYSVAEDGYPEMSDDTIGRLAFIWDGCIVSGWPLHVIPGDDRTSFTGQWEPSEDRFGGPVEGVEYWLLLPRPAWSLHKEATSDAAR